MVSRNVIVCDKCLRASCWRGFMCEESTSAGLTTRTPAELAELDREHSDYYAKDDNYPDAERPGPQ